jgi:tetratricopeptide (TPR) repeat protein
VDQLIGAYDDAVKKLQQILYKSPDYIPALHSLGETYRSMCQKSVSDGIFSKAKHYMDLSIKFFDKCTILNPSLATIWKNLGDSYNMAFYLGNFASNEENVQHPVTIKDKERFQKQKDAMITSHKTKVEYLEKAIVCYQKASQLPSKQSHAHLLYDIGVTYWKLMKLFMTVEPVRAATYLTQAHQSLSSAIYHAPSNSTFWEALGIIETNPDRKQHCFIKAAQLDDRNHRAWTNLGWLYFNNGKIQQAQKAFEQSLSVTVNENSSWIGLGMIQELVISRMPNSDLSDSDTSHRLQILKSAKKSIQMTTNYDIQWFAHKSLGYLSFHLKNFSSCADALSKYLIFDPLDIDTHFLFGICMENLGKLDLAQANLEFALHLLMEKMKGNFSENSNVKMERKEQVFSRQIFLAPGTFVQPSDKLDLIRLNLARVFSKRFKLGHLKIEDQAFPSHIFPPKEPETMLCYAMSFYHTKQVEKSIELLETLKDTTNINGKLKQEALLLLSKIYFSRKNHDKAKANIAQCMKLFPQYIKGI